MTSPLAANIRIVAELREKLKAEHGLEDGEDALEDTLQGETDLPEILAAMARKAKRVEGYAKACCEIASDNLARSATYERQKDALRTAIAWALVESGMKKIPKDVAPDLSVYTSPGKASLDIPDDTLVPRHLCRVKEVVEPNRTLIREMLEAGEQYNWATLGTAKPTLTIRSR